MNPSWSGCRVHLAVTLVEEEDLVEEEAVVAAVEAMVVEVAMEVVEADEEVEGMTRATVVAEEDMVVEALVEAVVAVATKQLFMTHHFSAKSIYGSLCMGSVSVLMPDPVVLWSNSVVLFSL